MRFRILILTCCFITSICCGQKVTHTSLINLGFDRIGDANFYSLGYKVSSRHFGEFESNFSTMTTGLGVSKINNRQYWAPGITYNFYGILYYTGANITCFIGDNAQDIRLAPQIGLTWFNALNVGYSYYIPIIPSNEIKVIGRHSLNLSISWPIGDFF